MEPFLTLTPETLEQEHLCCAIADKKHQAGVVAKKQWLRERLAEGHVFRKLPVQGKVFIEYAPLETAWVPVEGENYLYIYCLWVSGKYQKQGYGGALLASCIEDAKAQGKSGICILSGKKKLPFLSDPKFLKKHGFTVADETPAGYTLCALSFDGTMPRFTPQAKQQSISEQALTIYYGKQCPFLPDCVKQVQQYCEESKLPLRLMPVETLEQAKEMPCVFQNWAVFYHGRLLTLQLLNANSLQKLLEAEN